MNPPIQLVDFLLLAEIGFLGKDCWVMAVPPYIQSNDWYSSKSPHLPNCIMFNFHSNGHAN